MKSLQIGAVVAFLACGCAVAQTTDEHVVKAEIAQYRIVVENGSRLDICIHAGLVKAAMLQAQDSFGYKDWAQVENNMCKVSSADTLRSEARRLAGGVEGKEEEIYWSLVDEATQYAPDPDYASHKHAAPPGPASFGKYCISVKTGARVLCSDRG